MFRYGAQNAKEVIDRNRPYIEKGFAELNIGLLEGAMDHQTVDTLCRYFAMMCSTAVEELRKTDNGCGGAYSSTVCEMANLLRAAESEAKG